RDTKRRILKERERQKESQRWCYGEANAVMYVRANRSDRASRRLSVERIWTVACFASCVWIHMRIVCQMQVGLWRGSDFLPGSDGRIERLTANVKQRVAFAA
ncbi:hypothetical protein COCVIDRAFT_89596, partial [Bipolaris victoriae FI3]